MAQKNPRGINEAGKLVLKLLDNNCYWRLRADPTKCAEAPKELVQDVERLEVLLKKPGVGGVLSLANPYPAKIGFFWGMSYAQCICDMFKSKLGGSHWGKNSLPEDNTEILYHCIKELERVTKRPCNVEVLEVARRTSDKYRKRDDKIEKLYVKGRVSPQKISEDMKSKEKEWDCKPLSHTQIRTILTNRGVYEGDRR